MWLWSVRRSPLDNHPSPYPDTWPPRSAVCQQTSLTRACVPASIHPTRRVAASERWSSEARLKKSVRAGSTDRNVSTPFNWNQSERDGGLCWLMALSFTSTAGINSGLKLERLHTWCWADLCHSKHERCFQVYRQRLIKRKYSFAWTNPMKCPLWP